jgi:hypothetical protein
MVDGGKIVIGLLGFAALTTFPVWHAPAFGKPLDKPRLPEGSTEKECVAPTPYMREHHMEMLDGWRTQVVRHDMRTWQGPDGKQWQASLTKTCLKCHSNTASFCDTCHNQVGVRLVCFDCHVDPKGGK